MTAPTPVRGRHVAEADAWKPADDETRDLLRRLSRRYCWDSTVERALDEAPRVILRAMSVATWDDTIEMERIVGRGGLTTILGAAYPGALTPRAWAFWHHRLGLIASDQAPPPPPAVHIP